MLLRISKLYTEYSIRNVRRANKRYTMENKLGTWRNPVKQNIIHRSREMISKGITLFLPNEEQIYNDTFVCNTVMN